jgi:hypothetical protein
METNKTLYGLMAFGPIGLILLGVVFIIALVAGDINNHSSEPPAAFFLFMGLIFLAVLLNLGSLIMYIIHVAKNPRLDEGSRIGWILGMVFAHTVVCIVYFFVYIVNEQPVPYNQQHHHQQQPKGPWDV